LPSRARATGLEKATIVREKLDAVVVGGGPNGLAAAVTLAQAGLSVRLLEAAPIVGGGVRSGELTLPGFVHDLCSAIHPLAAGSPFFNILPLQRLGLQWIDPEIAVAHPLDDGRAACLRRRLDATAEAMGTDGRAYRRLMEPLASNWKSLSREVLRPVLRWPRHPLQLARLGLPALLPANVLAKAFFREELARALFAGLAAHSFLSFEAPASAAIGLILGVVGHAVGWPFPRGGAQKIADALAAHFLELGGEIQVDSRIDRLDQLPAARATLLDVSPWQLARMAALPSRYAQRLRRFRHAPGVCKVDYALSAPVPWKAEECRRAGTVHVGGGLDEVAAAEREVSLGRHATRPFVLVAQQSLFDESRAPLKQHTLWAYCHVPHGSTSDTSLLIDQQIERFAPGFHECILARRVSLPADLERRNPNLIGGDISGGNCDWWQLLARPVLSLTPYRTPLSGVYLCSASTPPGGGVHGMCGWNAAQAALREVFGKKSCGVKL
jgi:phytoene dehydrogenase-like protein